MKVAQENLRQFLQKVRSLWRKQIFVYTDEKFAQRNSAKISKSLLTGFRRGDTERVRFKRIFRIGKYTVIQRLCIAYLLFAKP